MDRRARLFKAATWGLENDGKRRESLYTYNADRMAQMRTGRRKFLPCPAAKSAEIKIAENYLRLLRLQICICSASVISWSRKDGCAMDMIASAFSQVESPFKFTSPYSVTR